MKHKRGFVLLLAVLVSGILLALGLALYNIASKELLLSSAGRDSQFAFYAADSGIECALYWDAKEQAFSTTSSLESVTCGAGTVPSGGGVAPVTRTYDQGTQTYSTTFSFSLGSNIADPCTDVTVSRRYNPTRTSIRADGYNTCVTSDPKRSERATRSNS